MSSAIPASMLVGICDCTDYPAWISNRDGIVRDILYNDASTADYNIAADRYPGHHLYTRANPYIVSHCNRIRIF